MDKQSYAEQIKSSEEVLGGVKKHQADFIEKGYTTEKFITDYEKLLRDTVELNNTQEKAKAELVSTTDQLNQNLDDLRRSRQNLKGIVRNFLPTTQWKSFGMTYHPRKSKSDSEPDDTPDDTNPDNDNPPPPLPPAPADEAEELKDIS